MKKVEKKNLYNPHNIHKAIIKVYVDKAHMENDDPIFIRNSELGIINVSNEEEEAIEAIIAQERVAKQDYEKYKEQGYPNVCVKVQMNGLEKAD